MEEGAARREDRGGGCWWSVQLTLVVEASMVKDKKTHEANVTE